MIKDQLRLARKILNDRWWKCPHNGGSCRECVVDLVAELMARETLRPSVEVFIERDDGLILAIQTTRYGGGFFGVGGKVEPSETFEQAAHRELREETGCTAHSMRFVAGHTLDPLPEDEAEGKWYCAGFVADIGDQEPRKSEPHTTPFWTTRERMKNESLFPEWYSWWLELLTQVDSVKTRHKGA